MTRVAVILSGCGFLDGAEIRESVLSLLYLDQQGARVSIFAPDIMQMHSINHLTQQPESAPRNVLVEAARIARSQIEPLDRLDASQFDALIIPGGYGVAKNLSNVAVAGAEAVVEKSFAQAVRAFYDAKKPIGAICIAPAVLAVILRDKGITFTIGEDAGTAGLIEAMGNHHQCASSREIVVDKAHRIATCSAYMRDDALSAIASGIEKVVYEVLSMVRASKQSAA